MGGLPYTPQAPFWRLWFCWRFWAGFVFDSKQWVYDIQLIFRRRWKCLYFLLRECFLFVWSFYEGPTLLCLFSLKAFFLSHSLILFLVINPLYNFCLCNLLWCPTSPLCVLRKFSNYGSPCPGTNRRITRLGISKQLINFPAVPRLNSD